MARQHLGEALERGKPLTDPAATQKYLLAKLWDMPHKIFACLYLDNRHRVIASEELFRGTIDRASVHPRERWCGRPEAQRGGTDIRPQLFAHNHPSAVAEPLDADRRLTRRLTDALALVDIRVLDHFVMGDGEVASSAERGWI
jgi:DNA repair protein RadC